MTTMIKSLRNANSAMQQLSSTWHEQVNGVKDLIEKIDYPFNKDFNELSYEFHNWCENVEEILIRHLPEIHCVCGEIDNDKGFEEGWFYQAKIIENEVHITEGIGSGFGRNSDVISVEEFKKWFFEVPEEMFNLYSKLNGDGEDTSDLLDLAIKLYDNREDDK